MPNSRRTTSKVPNEVRYAAKETLWAEADRLSWDSLTAVEKARHYQQWTDSAVGRRLAAHMDPRAVRVFIKDTLLKDYSRHVLKQHQARVLRILNSRADQVEEEFIKPHGLRLADGSQVVWGRADDWKALLGAAFERGFKRKPPSSTAVFFRSVPRYSSESAREMVEEAAKRLGITKTCWFD